LEVPGAAGDGGFDAIRIVPQEGDDSRSVGHLILDPASDAAAAPEGPVDGPR
jgi:hypothetical protein